MLSVSGGVRHGPVRDAAGAASYWKTLRSFWRTERSRAPRGVLLAIGAHPDDIEFGCGATLASYRDAGYETHGVVLSRGENGLGHSASRDYLRQKEALASAQILKLASLNVLAFPDSQLVSRRAEVKRAIEEAIDRLKPDVVLTHNRADLHFDHRLVHLATLEASRNVPTVLCYENPNTPPEFRPAFFVDVSAYIGCKIRALYRHASQRNRPYFRADLIRGIARARGHQARSRYAEAFEVVRIRGGSL